MLSIQKETYSDLPTQEEATKAFILATSSTQQYVRTILNNIIKNPPQALIIEGGTSDERFAIALWYTARLNCTHGTPCLTCSTCLQIGANIFHDLFLLNGSDGSIKIDDIRKLRAVFGEPSHGNGKKVILLAEAQHIRTEAANALLKSLEEPHPQICCLLLVPQREQLLPTLVSRSWTITIPGTSLTTSTLSNITTEWEEKLAIFLTTGRTWFNSTGNKNMIEASLVQHIISLVRKALVLTLTKQKKNQLVECLSLLTPLDFLHLQDILSQSESSLAIMVNPTLVLNRLVAHLYLSYHNAIQTTFSSYNHSQLGNM